MRKILSFLLFLFLIIQTFAQLDREHWFAPMIDRTGNPSDFQKLYLSTNRTTPFPVEIYNNNVLIGTVTISKGNPQKFDVLRQYIITTQQTDLFTPTTKGLYVKAEFPFYANLRFSVYNHGEIITSKGVPSTGTTFYTAMTPITVSNSILNFMTSVLATEDNTTVTVSGYAPNVQFSNGTTGTTNPTITFVLNKGQSYIIDGIGNLAQNWDGFIGAKIVANKPVNVTNGNFNGQYAGNIPLSSDIMMDQSVPVEWLGDEFAIVKGFGDIGLNMEGAIVIATENNTQIFVNNEIPPLATINEGEYFVIPDSKFILQGTGHYNLYIKTSKNAYVYQLLAGVDNSSGNSVATGGFNFIPALNCYLPKQIDELGLIDENQVFSNGNPAGILNIPTKLNLVTETGANVLVNGVTPLASTGPFPMLGTPNWVTYGIPNTTGNITVTSDKAITAGINAGSDAVGYGGFFAGFPTNPEIVATGTCFPNISLSVDPVIYEGYQWYLNGNPIPGATGPTYIPTIPGVYSAEAIQGSCAPLETAEFEVLKCMVNSTASYIVCESTTISPAFSDVTIPQNVDVSTISIVTPPTLGTVSINSTTGVIAYTPTTPGTAATDTFTYTFCGDHPDFPECETVTVTLNIQLNEAHDDTLSACRINNQGTFDLTTADITVNTSATITYYPTLVDAQNENAAAQINNFTSYSIPNGTDVYAVVTTPNGCKKIAKITLEIFPFAVVSDFTATYCDNNLDGAAEVTLSTITPQIVTNANYFTINYYQNLADATAGNTNTLPNNYTFTANTTIYIRVNSPDGCDPVIKPINLIFGDKISLLILDSQQFVCDDDLDGSLQVNLGDYINLYTTNPQVSASFHNSLADAQNDANAVNANQTLTGTNHFYIRFESSTACPIIAEIDITIKTPKDTDTLVDQTICGNATTVLDAGPGFDSYLWSTGETTQTITVGTGSYWVDLTFDGCVYRQFVEVLAFTPPVITAIDIQDGTVTVSVSGGTPPYQYSLDGNVWQDSNVFYNLIRGSYTVFVRDANRCTVVQKEFSIINLINAITPNDDGFNDQINYSELSTKEDILFVIFDRYGQELFRGSPKNNYIWNGKYKSGRPVPTATYWYILEWKEFGTQTTIKYSSWLLVKNRDDSFFND